MKNKIKTAILSGALIIPMSKESWTELKFGKIPANTVRYANQVITVDVKKSASPLIYKLEKSVSVQSFDLEIKVNGQISDQDKNFSEDSYFRIGLVAEGEQRLTGLKKVFSPDWVKKLFSLAPDNVGLDKIYFFNIMPLGQKINDQRKHPKSDLMEETIIVVRKIDETDIKVTHSVPLPKKISALWISIDGDDTKSEFQTIIKKISLNAVQ